MPKSSRPAAERPASSHSAGHSRKVHLPSGAGTLTLSLDVNLLQLSTEDRTFVFAVIDLLEAQAAAAQAAADAADAAASS